MQHCGAENIDRLRQKGMPAMEAAYRGLPWGGVRFSLNTVMVFIPILIMELSGNYFATLPWRFLYLSSCPCWFPSLSFALANRLCAKWRHGPTTKLRTLLIGSRLGSGR